MNKNKKYSEIPSVDKARLVAEWLEAKQAENIVIMDVTGLSSVTDITVVVSARGVKHAKALAENILERCSEENIEFLAMEGQKTGEWVLVDLNDVLVHIFLDELRDFYNLEGMWGEAPRVELEA
ncbi:ribosome silencing factor [Pseudodesulfovibrio cashew]|uniref:Ribosomal silencing factor RsfS n=1 Tax=Pseudodesulfovibrio cashew TaxID=2678688 RepID=A0A6I6JPY5_9BACT|nr:ribosome silencing factor [Pseudodesulfovibrio cashew]QGY42073.1 ribosome silencing factor [Pseudodesulfovibrio cashew]